MFETYENSLKPKLSNTSFNTSNVIFETLQNTHCKTFLKTSLKTSQHTLALTSKHRQNRKKGKGKIKNPINIQKILKTCSIIS